ncbi:1-acyl-sn-glycerol-3-phosphate acyltransferase [Nocardioides convexus]|uniref:1-acyl-sn-glycerol-3-phosphate acyltransferase n=1 Tax=Nocardioides convexus TaxID=2712224 RepID=UPI0024182181|nr:1-acyl-sn-glycerol-3-phosphate acyltransferase [Nocardioides convexus]
MAHPMRVRRTVARGLLRLTRWRLVGQVPESGILVGAPHTSQWDWVAMLMIAWAHGVRPHVLVADRYFKGLVGWVLRHTGGIPLDRSSPGATIRALLVAAEQDDAFQARHRRRGHAEQG